MTFTDLCPTPDHETATARQAAGWIAAEALYLLGRAERRRELHGPADATYLNLLSLVPASTTNASLLADLVMGADADQAARQLLTGIEAGDLYAERASAVARWGGYDPDQVRRAGYES